MRLILTILLIGLFKANAQIVINASAPYRPIGGFNGLLDTYSGAAAAYSLRKLDKDYTGNAIRVRKDTTGQPEQDIAFTAAGDLDTAAIKSFLNARSGFVVTWYDQSGSSPARNVTQATQANQPEIAQLGVIHRVNNIPSVRFFSTDFLSFSSTYTITHTVQVARVNSQNVINYIYSNANNGFFWNGTFAGVNGIGGFDGTNLRSITGEDLNQHLAWYSLRSSSINIARDGGSETNAGTFASSITVDRIGGRTGSSIDFRGDIQEVVSWNSDQSANKTGIESNINTYYSIY